MTAIGMISLGILRRAVEGGVTVAFTRSPNKYEKPQAQKKVSLQLVS